VGLLEPWAKTLASNYVSRLLPARHFGSSTKTGICLSVFSWYSA
jgi:hypothetical protein